MHAAEPAATSLAAAWPIYGLRIRSEHLVLRLPTDDDLLALIDLARGGIHPLDDLIIIDQLNAVAIADVVEDLVKTGEIRGAMTRAEDDESSD